MIIWLDAQLSPGLAHQIEILVGVKTVPVRDLGLRDASDLIIFQAARDAEAILMTKDQDFVELAQRLGSPPKVIWLVCGNTSNQVLMGLLKKKLPQVLSQLESGENLVELD